MASGPRRDDDMTGEPPAFSDEGMRKIIYRQDGDSRSSSFAQDTEELEADLRGRRSLVPVVTALAAIFCFGAIIWYAYTWGTGQMASENLPEVLAQPMPEKVKPDQPGGMDVPHQGIAVLNEGERGNGTQPVERLLPAPESPTPPEPMPQMAESGEVGQLPAPEEAPLVAETPEEVPAEMADMTEVPEPPAEVPDEADVPETAQLADGSGTITLPLPKPGEDPQRDQIAALIEEEPLETANGEPSEAPLPVPTATQTAALTGGDVVLQLSSVKSEAAAESEWARLQQAHPEELGSLFLALDTAEVQGTTYYRVQTGPFASRAAAADLCAQLKARNQDCLVTQR